MIANLAYPKSACTIAPLFHARWTATGVRVEQGMVVRIKPTAHMVYPDDLFDQQYELMTLITTPLLVVAKPLWIERDASILGADSS